MATLLVAMMRSFILALLLACPAFARQPNIVFIIADDLGYGDLGCYGQTKIRTPNLDRMAAEGLRLTQHYAGNAVCAPSRCVLMTGKHPGHAFIRNNRELKPEGQQPIPASEITMAEVFKAAGYTTGGFGKWGLGSPGTDGEPMKQGFDRWFGYNCQARAHTFYPATLWDDQREISIGNEPPVPGHGVLEATENPDDPASYKRFQGQHYSADLIWEQARAFIRANKAQPFFCYAPTTVPHLALQVPDDSLKAYQGQWEDPPYKGGKGYLPHFAPRAAYAAMVTRMDEEIGRTMQLIKELALDEHTIFVFTSDNGALNGTHAGLAGTDAEFFNSCGGLRDGKGSLYEGGVRVPGIVRWTGKVKPGVSDRVTGFEDWLPTLAELAASQDKAPSAIDGISFATTLRGEAQPERAFLYREFPAYGGQQTIRAGDWKLVRQKMMANGGKRAAPKNQPIVVKSELYDLKSDVTEAKDVATEYPDIVAKLEALLPAQHEPSSMFPFPVLDAAKPQ
jgi:arylsulfatase A